MASFNFVPTTELEATKVKAGPNNSVEGEPVFYRDGSTEAAVAVFTVKDSNNKVIHSYRVVINGKTLAATLEERTGPVPSKFESQQSVVTPPTK